MDPTSWTTGKSRTRTSSLPLSYFIQFCYLPTSFLFTQMWPSSQRPLSGSFIMSLDLAKNRGTEIIWTKERDALGFGFQPPCQRAKMADCPSVSLISICLQLCPASAGAKVGEPSCWANFWTKNCTSISKQNLNQSERDWTKTNLLILILQSIQCRTFSSGAWRDVFGRAFCSVLVKSPSW